MTPDTPDSGRTAQPAWLPLALYGLVLAGWLTGALLPHLRLWGFGLMAYFPAGVMTGILAAAAAVGLAGWWFAPLFLSCDSGGTRRFALTALIVSLLLLAAFYVLRAKTFFLGDGYTLISDTAAHSPMVRKSRELFESVAHIWLFNRLGGASQADAIAAYRLIAYVSGIVYIGAVWLSARALLERGAGRLLFFLGMISGGWMLLYFGYVENYAVYVLAVAVYCLTGPLAIQGRISRWWVVLIQLLLIGFHILGAVFIPATLYLLLRDTGIEVALSRLSRAVRWSMGLLGVAVVIAALVYVMSTELFFRVSLVPLLSSPLVPEHYTLFSAAHLLDYLNLLFLLIPGLLLLVVAVPALPLRSLSREPLYRWLALAVVGALGAAFVIDPKLGMPRDWDLLAFAGVPFAVLLYYAVVTHRARLRRRGTVVVLAALLGFVALTSRGIWQATPQIAIDHYRDYLQLDRVKGRTGWIALVNYYLTEGDTTTATAVRAEFKRTFPEDDLLQTAAQLYNVQHDVPGTERLLRHILELNPAYPDAYSFLGWVYTRAGKYDSALVYLKRADALSPNRPDNLVRMAQAYLGKGESARGEELLLKAAALDSSGYNAQYNLARYYRKQGRIDDFVKYLQMAAASDAAPKEVREEMIVVDLSRGRLDRARDLYCTTPTIRADSTFLTRAVNLIPGADTLLICR